MTTAAGPVGDADDLLPMDRAVRLDRLRRRLADDELDALVVTKPQNIRWLTGFTGSAGTAVVTEDELTVITDDRYEIQVAQQLEVAGVSATVAIDRDRSGPVGAGVGTAARVGLEAAHLTWDLARQVERWLDGRDVVATVDLVEALRQDKDAGEIARLRRAAGIADAALALLAPSLVVGRTERAIARELDRLMIDLGADGLSFPTIVAAGPNSAKPHATPSDRPLAPGDAVVMDFGAAVDGYGSDMTRSFLLDPVADEVLDRYRAVEAAQAAGVATVVAGVEERTVDAACRDLLTERGLGEAFVHGTGHGIGLEIHEQPFLSTRATGSLRAGQVVTVEPGVYLPGDGGIRIEDSVLVTDDGGVALTGAPKDHLVPTD
ncbi:MAG: aminopeptidase P family protein [Actinomycetota bacterium]